MSNFSDLIDLGEWAPDQPSVAGLARVARNVLTNGRYYRPFPKISPIGDALASPCRGADSFITADGLINTFAGTETKLYRYNDGAWDDVTRASGDYTTGAEQRWSFAPYGNRIIATNYSNDPQSFLVGTDTEFSLLSADAPRAKHVAVINNFVFLGNTPDANNSVAWSGLDAPTVWGTNIALQSDSQLLENGQGAVRGIFGNQNYGVILQAKGITRVEYVGPPEFFRFTDIERSRGAFTDYGNAGIGNEIFYLEESGFYRFNGSNSINIGENRVSRWFFNDFDSQYAYNVSCVIDPVNTVAVWSYPDKNATDGAPNKFIIYDWVDNRWTYGEEAHQILFRAYAAGTTLEGLDAISTNLDALPFSLDSNVWKGGKTSLAVFGSDSKLGFFTGTAKEAQIQTTEAMINSNGRAFVSGVYLESDATNYSMAIESRNLPNQTPVTSGTATPSALSGACDFAVDARYHRANIVIAEDDNWTQAVGVKIKAEPTGML